MTKKGIIGIISIIIVGFVLIITIPITILSIGLSPYGIFNKSIPFEYTPDTPSPIERLNLNVDIGNIEIKYINPPVNYIVKIDVNFEMTGPGLAGKSYLDFFDIEWQNTHSPVNFTMRFKPNVDESEVLSLLKNVIIVVILRADIIFDIKTNLIEGNYEITVPYAVSIGNIITNVSNGNILYDFEYSSTIQGNITGITNNGDLELKSYNVEYTQNGNWLLISTGGNMNIEIYQYKEMGANITGTAIISTGVIDLFYHDNSPNIGAIFDFPLSWWYIPRTQPGFESTILDNGFFYKSNDFPTNSNYNISFYHLGGQGPPNHFIEIHSD